MSELRKYLIKARASAGALPLGHRSRAGLRLCGRLLWHGFFDLDGRRPPIEDAWPLSDGHNRGTQAAVEFPHDGIARFNVASRAHDRIDAGARRKHARELLGHVPLWVRASIDLIRFSFLVTTVDHERALDMERAEMAVFAQGASQELVEHFERRVWMARGIHVELLTQPLFARPGVPELVAVGETQAQ